MARSNRTRYPVLGMLAIRPMSGYDIKKFVEGSIANFWRESYGQLYPTLRRLADEGLVERQLQTHTGKPDRYLYRITSAGRETLREWLTEPPESEVPRSELLLKLFFGTEVAAAVSVRHVRQRRSELEANLARLSALEEGLATQKPSSPSLPYWRLTVRLGVLLDQAHLNWCNEAERELEKLT